MYNFLLVVNLINRSPHSFLCPVPYGPIILCSLFFLIPILVLKSPIMRVYCIPTASISSFISSYISSMTSSLYADVGDLITVYLNYLYAALAVYLQNYHC